MNNVKLNNYLKFDNINIYYKLILNYSFHKITKVLSKYKLINYIK